MFCTPWIALEGSFVAGDNAAVAVLLHGSLAYGY